MRILWLILGALSVLLGVIGAVLPLLPTVPFLLLAAFSFARSSDRLHDWLIHHPRLGPPIRDWRASGAIRRRIKVYATLSMLAAFAIALIGGMPAWALGAQACALVGAGLFVWSRPETGPETGPETAPETMPAAPAGTGTALGPEPAAAPAGPADQGSGGGPGSGAPGRLACETAPAPTPAGDPSAD